MDFKLLDHLSNLPGALRDSNFGLSTRTVPTWGSGSDVKKAQSLGVQVLITTVFLAVSQFDVYLEETHAITGYQKNFLKAPVQFLLIFVVSLTVLHFFSHWFHVKT